MDFENQKTCSKCQLTKPLEAFSGKGNWCKECRKAYHQDWYAKNRDTVLQNQKNYYASNTEACVATRKRYAKNNPERTRETARERSRKAAGLPAPTRPCPDHCEMCLRPAGKRALHLDHCHTTGAFRGWLCGCCNTAFGRLGDSFEEVTQRLERYKLTVNQGDE